MVFRITSFMSIVFFALALPSIGNAQQGANLRVISTADDNLGSQLVSAIRQEFARDPRYRLVYGDEPGMRVRIVTLRTSDSVYNGTQNYTIYSVVVTFYLGSDGTDMYFDQIVGTCGANRIRNCASSISASVSETLTALRESLARTASQEN
jgi:hypothetical protein